MQEQGATGLTDEACAALRFVSRRACVKPSGEAVQDDTAAWSWIRQTSQLHDHLETACKEQDSMAERCSQRRFPGQERRY